MALSTKADGHFYMRWEWRAWLTEPTLRVCTFAEKGLWVDILMLMCEQNPRGVMPGNLKVLSAFLGKRPGEVGRLLEGLERARVFSRGRDVSETLPADAVVNRRMYSEWLLSQARSEAGRKGGKQKSSKSEAKSHGVNGGGARGSEESAEANRQANRKQRYNLVNDYPLESDSESDVTTVPVERARGRGVPIAVGSVLARLQQEAESGLDGRPSPVGLQRIVTRMVCVTGDAGSEASWRKFALAFSRTGEAFGTFLREVCDFEDSLRLGDVRNRGAVLTARLQACAGRLGIGV